MRNPRRTLALLGAATGLYSVGFLWLVPTSPYKESLFLVAGLLIAGHWTLWRPWNRGVATREVRATGTSDAALEVAGSLSRDILSISTGLYVVSLALAIW